jgi:hypothetical protein
MSYAPSATNISVGDKTKLIRGLDAFALVNGIPAGFIDSLTLRPKNPIVAYMTGQPAQTILLVRDEQGFDFSLGLAQLGAQQMAWGTGQAISQVAGTPYTQSAVAYTFAGADFEGNQFITLPDGDATSVSITSDPSGTTYTGAGTDYKVQTTTAGTPAVITRVSGGAITSGETVLVTATMTPVAASFVNIGAGTPLQANMPVVLKFRNPQSGNINYYQHSAMNLAAGPNSYVWDIKGKTWQNATLTMEALPDPAFLDPLGNSAPFGFVYIPT